MWEYKTISIKAKGSFLGGKFDTSKIDDELSAYGKEGCELVKFVTYNRTYGDSGFLICVFKRERRF